MESKMKKYEKEVISQLLDAGFYIKKQYGVLVVGETSEVGNISFRSTGCIQMDVPHTVESFSRIQIRANDLPVSSRNKWDVAVEIFRRGLTEAGVFDEYRAERQAVCSGCLYGYACDDSCPHLNRKGYVV